MAIAVMITLVAPTVWQRTSIAVYGPMEPADPRVDALTELAVSADRGAQVTLLPMADPNAALCGHDDPASARMRELALDRMHECLIKDGRCLIKDCTGTAPSLSFQDKLDRDHAALGGHGDDQ